MAPAAAPSSHTLASPRVAISVFAAVRNRSGLSVSIGSRRVGGISVLHSQRGRMVVAAATKMPLAAKGEGGVMTFVEEMRAVAMRLHTKDQAKEGEMDPEEPSVIEREPTVEGYLLFLVNSKLVFQTLENIVNRAAIPYYVEFRNTGLERSEALKKDLKWFSDQGHRIPEPSAPGTKYASYLEELSEDPQAFICHFYNVYFAHSAGGRSIGKKIAEKILNKRELEFYKWEGTLSQLLQNTCTKLNQVASSWSIEEKNRCLEETQKAFAYSMDILRYVLT